MKGQASQMLISRISSSACLDIKDRRAKSSTSSNRRHREKRRRERGDFTRSYKGTLGTGSRQAAVKGKKDRSVGPGTETSNMSHRWGGKKKEVRERRKGCKQIGSGNKTKCEKIRQTCLAGTSHIRDREYQKEKEEGVTFQQKRGGQRLDAERSP